MKLFVVLLVVLLLLFILGAGFSLGRPRTKKPDHSVKDASSRDRSPGENFLAKLPLPAGSSSPLKKSVYRAGDAEELVGRADSIRRVKFRLTHSDGCDIPIHYVDNAPHDHELNDQLTHLNRHEDEGKDKHKDETTIVLMTTGGRISFGSCGIHKNGGCPGRLEVVK